MAEFTPGPWKFDGENDANQGFDVALPDGGVLATAYYDVDRDEYSVSQAEANAWLIAAVPDLLRACKDVRDWILKGQTDLDALAVLDGAIAKAEGD